MALHELRNYAEAEKIMENSVMRLFGTRNAAHLEFDRLWMEGLMTRHEAYFLLQYILGITDRSKAHFALLRVEQCNEVIRKLRLSYTIPNFFRFLERMKFERKRKKYIGIATHQNIYDTVLKNLKVKHCKACGAWKENKFFTKSKKNCDDCLSEYLLLTKTQQEEMRWIKRREYIRQIEENLKAKEITNL